MAETPEPTFDEVVAEAGSTLASKYAEAVAAQEAAQKAATPGGTTPPEPAPSAPGDAAPAGGNEAPKVEEKKDDFDPEKTLSRYKTQEEKDAALVEKDRELLKRSKQNEERDAEIARLKAENENLKAGRTPAPAPATTPEPPTPGATPEAKEFRPWLEAVVTAENPQALPPYLQPVHAEFSKLRAGKAEIDSTGAKITELKTKESTLSEEIRTLDGEISTLDKALRADPDSLAVKDMLEAARASKAQKEIDYSRTQTSRSILTSELATKTAEFKEYKTRYERGARELHSDLQAHEARSTEAKEEDARLKANWDSAIKTRVLDRTDLDADQKASIVESLEARLNRIDGDLPSDFGPWIDGHKDVFARELRKSANGAASAATREGGNAPRTPANGTVTPPEPRAKGNRKDTVETVIDDASRKFESFFAPRA